MADKKDNIIDIDLSVTEKKKFRIDGDNDRIIELNTSDMNIVSRLEETYQKLNDLAEKAMTQLNDDATLSDMANVLKEIDNSMKELLDFVFDSDVSKICAPDGNMFDLFNGQFRFEHIIEVLSGLYENNFNSEFKKMENRIKEKTAKYTG